MIGVWLSYKFTNLVVKGDTCWCVSTSSVGYAPPVEHGDFPSHKFLLPEEEPASGTKRTLQDAIDSPQKSAVVGKIVKVSPLTFRREGTLPVRSLGLKDTSGKPVKVTVFEKHASQTYLPDSVVEVTAVYQKTYQNRSQLTSTTTTTCQLLPNTTLPDVAVTDDDVNAFKHDPDFNVNDESSSASEYTVESILEIDVYSCCNNTGCRKKKLVEGLCRVCQGQDSSKTVHFHIEIFYKESSSRNITIFESQAKQSSQAWI